MNFQLQSLFVASCWWHITIILLLASLRGTGLPPMDLVYCQFLKTLTELLKLKRQCVLSARQLLEDFMALYVIKDPFINESDSDEVRATKWQLAHEEENQIRQSLR